MSRSIADQAIHRGRGGGSDVVVHMMYEQNISGQSELFIQPWMYA